MIFSLQIKDLDDDLMVNPCSKWHQGKTQISESEYKLMNRQDTYLQLHPDAYQENLCNKGVFTWGLYKLPTFFLFAAY